jgi:hypothetical protein
MRLGNGFSVLVKDERDNQLRKPKRWVIVHCRPFSESTDLRYAKEMGLLSWPEGHLLIGKFCRKSPLLGRESDWLERLSHARAVRDTAEPRVC